MTARMLSGPDDFTGGDFRTHEGSVELGMGDMVAFTSETGTCRADWRYS